MLTGKAVDNRLVQFLHGGEHKCVKQVPHLFPERTFVVSPLLPGGLKQRAAQLLRLVHEEDQQHHHHQHHGQILRAMSVVVFEIVTLIFQGVEGLVLNLPAGPSANTRERHVLAGNVMKAAMVIAIGYAWLIGPILKAA